MNLGKKHYAHQIEGGRFWPQKWNIYIVSECLPSTLLITDEKTVAIEQRALTTQMTTNFIGYGQKVHV